MLDTTYRTRPIDGVLSFDEDDERPRPSAVSQGPQRKLCMPKGFGAIRETRRDGWRDGTVADSGGKVIGNVYDEL